MAKLVYSFNEGSKLNFSCKCDKLCLIKGKEGDAHDKTRNVYEAHTSVYWNGAH